jgi:hypothetical protein
MGPSSLPCRGVSNREVHGVPIRPMKTNPASFASCGATATSAVLISFSLTIG